jgi:tetratricopeptide (TPR) repeat protein
VKTAVLLVCCYAGTLWSQILENPQHHRLLLQGIRYSLEQRYDSAETTFRTVIARYPEHPSGYLYLAGMYQAQYTDYGTTFNARQYDSLLTAAGACAKKMTDNTPTAAWGYYYAGMADAFRSFTASENGNLPTGFYYGISAGGSLERCLEIDSTFDAAKNILGSYYYWRSKLAWIPFVSDRTDEGIRLINESLNHPYEKHLASHNLMLVLTDEKRYAEAEKIGTIMLTEYPDNRSYLWNMVTVYEQWGKTPQLVSTVERLLKSALDAPVINRYTEAACRLKIAQDAYRQQRFGQVREECEKIVALRKYIGKTKGNLKKKISQAEELLSSINKK